MVLAVIPLLGFLANGTAFTTGQAEVENEFNSVKQANTLSETSHDLKKRARQHAHPGTRFRLATEQ
ncbi:MAG: hypothetical protein ABWY66_04400 [Xanthobacteraceae bacterium]